MAKINSFDVPGLEPAYLFAAEFKDHGTLYLVAAHPGDAANIVNDARPVLLPVGATFTIEELGDVITDGAAIRRGPVAWRGVQCPPVSKITYPVKERSWWPFFAVPKP